MSKPNQSDQLDDLDKTVRIPIIFKPEVTNQQQQNPEQMDTRSPTHSAQSFQETAPVQNETVKAPEPQQIPQIIEERSHQEEQKEDKFYDMFRLLNDLQRLDQGNAVVQLGRRHERDEQLAKEKESILTHLFTALKQVVSDDSILYEALAKAHITRGNLGREDPNNFGQEALPVQENPMEDEDRAVYLLVKNMKYDMQVFPYGDYNYPITIKWTGETRNGIPHGLGNIISDQSSCPHNNFTGIAYMTNGKLAGPMKILDKDGVTRCHSSLTEQRVSGQGREYWPEDPYYFRREKKDPNLKATCYLQGEYQEGLAHGYCKYYFEDGRIFDGTFQFGRMVEGLMKLKDGKVFRVQYNFLKDMQNEVAPDDQIPVQQQIVRQ